MRRPALQVLRWPDDTARWQELADAPGDGDVYFTPAYASLFADANGPAVDRAFGGRPLLFVYGDADRCILHPLIQRPLTGLPLLGDAADGLCDLVSPYGYAGPLLRRRRAGTAHAHADSDAEGLAAGFWQATAEYCAAERIVSEFVRFHPVLGNHRLAPPGAAIERRRTVVVELGPSLERGFSGSTRQRVRRARRAGVRVELGARPEDVGLFARLYARTMERVGAQPEYRLPPTFFANLLGRLGDRARLLVARRDRAVSVAAIFLRHGDLVHYAFAAAEHTAGALAGANHALLATAMRWARATGAKRMHLGGGHASPDDGLFRFKRSFSRRTLPYYCLERVHRPDDYRDLVEARRRHEAASGTEGGGSGQAYFPAYRR